MKIKLIGFSFLFVAFSGCQSGVIDLRNMQPQSSASPTDLREIREAAQRGDPKAQYLLGSAYANGQGVAQDLPLACDWLLKSARGGNSDGQVQIAAAYLGRVPGFNADFREGVQWLRRASDQGNALAKTGLGFCYEEGKGVPQDNKEAMKWYLEAANAGEANAQFLLGVHYEMGIGVEKDLAQAAHWHLMAANQGLASAQSSYGYLCFEGSGVPQDYEQASKWFRMAAEQGDPHGESGLGLCYEFGDGVPKDIVEGYSWMNLAAAGGDPQLGKARDNLKKLLTPEQIEEGQTRSREFVPHTNNASVNRW